MEAYVMDAFSAERFGGNQAGVVLPEGPLTDEVMQQIAAELKHSETAFVTQEADGGVTLRYFTPAGEVPLCGHATVASFTLLRGLGRIGDGDVTAHTRSGELTVTVRGSTVWMDMANPALLRVLGEDEWGAFYEAYGLTVDDRPEGLAPAVVSAGLADVMLPVRDRETLLRAAQNAAAVTALSRRYEVTGVHMFCIGADCTAFCSNFAPLYDIPEECATGTSNAALTYYLYLHGRVKAGVENVFVQGEHMHRPSEIRTVLTERDGGVHLRVGGSAVMSMACDIKV